MTFEAVLSLFRDTDTGSGRVRGKFPCPRQLEHSAGNYQQHIARPHLSFWGILIVVKGSRDRERKTLFYAKLTFEL